MRRTVCALSALLLFHASPAQIKTLKNFGADEGLCQSHVFSICEDRLGFLWFGTYNGVSRWNGSHFVTFDKSDGMAGDQVTVIYEGRDSTVYFGTDAGLSCYTNGKFESKPIPGLPADERIQAIHQLADGTIFIGTARRGLWVCSRGVTDTLTLRSGLPSNAITCLSETDDGTLVVGTKNGVCLYRDGQLSCPQGLGGLTITHICPLAAGGFAFSTVQEGVLVYRDQNVSPLPFNDILKKNRVYAVAEDREGTLFCATFGGGVLIIDHGRLERLTEANGLAHNNVFAIWISRSGPVYFGTVAGVSIYKHGVLSVYNEDVGIAKNFVISICEGLDGTVYFGTFGGGVTGLKDGHYDHLNRQSGLAGNMVYCVREIDGVLYCGTTEGLSTWRNGRFTTVAKSEDGQPLRIRSIISTRKGDILLADARGLCRFKRGRVELIREVTEGRILGMSEDAQGVLYLATDKGAFTYDGFRLQTVAQVPSTVVFAVRVLDDGRIYYGTDLGLCIQQGDSVHTLTVADGLLHNSIADILQDRAGRIYLLTMRGVNIIDESGTSPRIRSLQHGDGLASDECSANSGWTDRQGRIWIGSIRGATCYDPSRDRPNPVPPQVHIERMRLVDQDIALLPARQLPAFRHDQNYFKFDFIGINLHAPDRVRYQYRMIGVDAGWVETRETYVQYTSLDDGHYEFQVKACNEWGVWSQPARVAFTIRPAFWETWWFLALISAAATGLTAFFIFHRVQRLLSIERLRTRIAADLHDHIGSGLTEISILSEVASQTCERSAPQVIPTFKKISEISRTLVDNMSDIVWLVNPKRDSLYDLLVRLKDSYQDVLTCAGITLQTQNLDQLQRLHLPMDYRQNLYLILKEALNNSLKHSQSRQISLQAGVHHRRLHLSLTDDGVGFDPQDSSTGDGLSNMQRRAKNIGGSLSIHSIQGEGTRIEFAGRF